MMMAYGIISEDSFNVGCFSLAFLLRNFTEIIHHHHGSMMMVGAERVKAHDPPYPDG